MVPDAGIPLRCLGDGPAALMLGLALLTPLVDRGPRALRVATVIFAGLMALNGVAHITGTIAGVYRSDGAIRAPNAWLMVIAALDWCRSVLHCARTGSRRRHSVTASPRSVMSNGAVAFHPLPTW